MNPIFDKEAFKASAVQLNIADLEFVKRCLILVPHPDDESLACTGLISILKEQGTEFKIILTTDGSRSHPNSKKFPTEKLAQIREEELNKAIKLMGLDTSVIIPYKGIDSGLPARGEDGFEILVARLAEDLAAFKPDLILVPYELDPHRDHRATWQMLMAALEKGTTQRPKIWEYPIWLYELAQQADLPKLNHNELKFVDVHQYSTLKQSCIAAHSSQTTRLIDDDPTGFILTAEMISNFTTGQEYFMERKKINPSSTLSEDYFETLYNNNEDPWNFEKSEYERQKYERSLAAIPPGKYNQALEIGCSIGVFTAMLAPLCSHLTAMDISTTALEKARQRLGSAPHVEFQLGAIPNDFPEGDFDLIVMSEVGYYLSMKDLLLTRELLENSLNEGGILLLVHWTHFVVDYPLSGDDVHECFKQSSLIHLRGSRTADYRIDIFKKR
ncbi:bifunctional PIG-L family deacetylase/class I SAM-dependent methyltransferase [Pedobacter agri]|uniref:Bifunctional PIG-L family deacetylase/class I SAM-dependent methyltransferase n=1 Tax=Pedobacter agri TaxID=454586 RepID=A0A9X3DGA0_9SPHI|nr:bifunctional PIG-L family deacetylase/class I SAM-dependent methyltransferase [Pedobacter agri]MCX3267248.1 bifunctional PIG-L family deacetylase/class I SAM-dependent methyltransferase [Pedobacter agri]